MSVDLNPFEKEYYDFIYQNSIKYSKHYSDIIYNNIWTYVSNKIINKNKKVIEIGCGPGHLSHLLYDEGFKGGYIGIDFSKVAIDMSNNKINSEEYTFILSDIKTYNYGFLNDKYLLIAIETMEHIENDIDFLKKLPKIEIILSIPNYESKNHYRVYNSEEQILEYYKDVLNIDTIKKFEMSLEKFIFVVEGRIK